MQLLAHDANVWQEPHASARRGLYDDIAAAPADSTIRLIAGEDFPKDNNPNRYRQRIISALRHRNLRIESRIKDGDIFVRVLGTYSDD